MYIRERNLVKIIVYECAFTARPEEGLIGNLDVWNRFQGIIVK